MRSPLRRRDSHSRYRTVAPDGTVTGIDADFPGRARAGARRQDADHRRRGQLNKLSWFRADTKRKATRTVATLLATRSGRADAAGMTEAAAIEVTQRQGGNKYVTQTARTSSS
ncbi:hypothetical protein [Amycolatopsis rifamycinica]|uniref:Uncharacterized protein n=1 Tax=Amycolatopsis rifamycinica TaxID=287986 RepID=A0A066TW45_9PSEU|nr:hypothetical protein [Amycolatopsis rifamycinica]KDN16099.1 hypothetical protein DV20_42955 [Amycolatopsis rifamycinica]